VSGGRRRTANSRATRQLAQALVTIANEEPPHRVIAGAYAIGLAEQKVAALQAQIDAHRDPSTSLAIEKREAAGRAPSRLQRSPSSLDDWRG
jgi:hypothetical protein